MSYNVVNINDFFDGQVGEKILQKELQAFDCKLNVEVENFLKNGAIISTKKGQSVTYLVFTDTNPLLLVGYFTLTIKPMTIPINVLSKKDQRKAERMAVLNKDIDAYHLSAYLLAQLGKNYAIPKDLQISGSELLLLAEGEIQNIKHSIGGVVMFLECEQIDKLISFYESKQYICSGKRLSNSSIWYLQYLKMI